MSSRLDTRGVHVFKKNPKTQQYSLSEVHPIQWLTREGQGRLAIQDGSVYSSSGERLTVKQIPAWFHEDVAKLGPEILTSLGYHFPRVST